jgi:hypothetical protein
MAYHHAILKQAVELALAGDWDGAHNIAQDYSDSTANWIHAVLHKIEGDIWNSNYWYARTAGKHYEDFKDAQHELQAILAYLAGVTNAP